MTRPVLTPAEVSLALSEVEVWIPPATERVDHTPGWSCRHCTPPGSMPHGRHRPTGRCAHCGRRRYRLDMIDFPTAWALQNDGKLTHTSERCSAVAGPHGGGPALLCDCGAVTAAWDAERRAAGLLPAQDGPAPLEVGAVLTERAELNRVPFRGVVISDDDDVWRRVGDGPSGAQWERLGEDPHLGNSGWLLTLAARWTLVWVSSR